MKNLKLATLVAVLMTAVSALVGCAGSSVKTVDTEIERKGISDLGTIGVKNNVFVIQKQTNADDELRSQQWENNQQEYYLNREYYDLKRCREEMADTRLGGNGEITPLPSIDKLKPVTEIKETLGITSSGNLQFVKEEDLLKRVQAERTYFDTLVTMKKTVIEAKEGCERKMKVARVKAGLPAERIQGAVVLNSQGRITKVLRKNENSLDDAFEIVREQRKPAQQVVPAVDGEQPVPEAAASNEQ